MEEKRPLSIFDRAIAMAAHAHAGQVDKAGQPYLLHVLRVMSHMTTDDERIVAILHDVVEDSDYTIEDVRAEQFPEEVVAAVALLTKPDSADYEKYVAAVSGNPLARAVKLADLEDNMDVRRITHPTDKDLARLLKYRRAWAFLRGEEGE